MIKFIIPFILCFSFSVFSKNIDHFRGSWLCIEEHGVGFNWNRDSTKWDPIGNYETRKYIFKTHDDNECRNFKDEDKGKKICSSFYEFGTEPYNWDKRLFTYIQKDDFWPSSFIEGRTTMYNFSMSEKGKFTKVYNVPGYVGDKGFTLEDGTTNHKDSMMIFVGSCSKI